MSNFNVDTVSDKAGTGPTTLTGQSAAKAWTCLDGTGTISGLNDFNVSSYTDNGTGDYEINLTNSFSDGDYCQTACTNNDISRQTVPASPASTMAMEAANSSGTAVDDSHVMAAGFGDLA